MERHVFEENGGALVVKFYAFPSSTLRDTLKEFGFKYYAKSKSWVGRAHIEDAKHAVLAWERRAMKLKGKTGRKPTLCCDCKRAGFGCVSTCPWEREFKPVPGWKAERNDIQMMNQTSNGKRLLRNVESYKVIECPLYEKEEKRVQRRAGSRT